MMLRSSSTPVLGSLLQSFSDCPNNNSNSNSQHQSELHKQTKISCPCNSNGGGSQDFKKSLIHPSPSLPEIKGNGGFRRAQSDGNLEGLGDASSYSVDEFNLPKRSSRRTSLEAIPSFSANNLWTSFEDDDDDYEGIDEDDDHEEIGGGFDYNPMRAQHMVFEKVARNAIAYGSEGLGSQGEGKMYLASGIGVSGVDFAGRGGGGGGRGSYKPVAFDKEGGGGGGVSVEEHYKRMLEQNPGDALFLRNYAEFLYKIKGDVEAAEEYYSRAILADQEDGETLSQYAKLLWEVHHDRDRAANYFQRALEASSQSSHVHAAYANFLWEAEDEDEDEDEKEENAAGSQRFLHQGIMASATA